MNILQENTMNVKHKYFSLNYIDVSYQYRLLHRCYYFIFSKKITIHNKMYDHFDNNNRNNQNT